KDVIMCRDKGQITVKGFTRPVQIYQVVDFRRDLGATSSYVEHELPGFSMYLDTNGIQNFDKERVIQALNQAAEKLRDKVILCGEPPRLRLAATPHACLHARSGTGAKGKALTSDGITADVTRRRLPRKTPCPRFCPCVTTVTKYSAIVMITPSWCSVWPVSCSSKWTVRVV